VGKVSNAKKKMQGGKKLKFQKTKIDIEGEKNWE